MAPARICLRQIRGPLRAPKGTLVDGAKASLRVVFRVCFGFGQEAGELFELEQGLKTTCSEVFRPSLVDLKADLGRSGREKHSLTPEVRVKVCLSHFLGISPTPQGSFSKLPCVVGWRRWLGCVGKRLNPRDPHRV